MASRSVKTVAQISIMAHKVTPHKKFPYEIRDVDEEFNAKMMKELLGQPHGLVEVGPQKWLLPKSYENYADKIYNFQARPDDVFICTYPRSGTTWTQEMIWLIANNLDYETALKNSLLERFPFLEYDKNVAKIR